MSVDWSTIKCEARRDAVHEYELHGAESLQAGTLAWMESHGKRYRLHTLEHFHVSEAWATCYKCAVKKRRSLWTDRVITNPAGPVTRCYRFTQEDKADRWRVVPPGLQLQWIGDLSGADLLLCEGEWDLFCAFDHGFTWAVTHTAGAGTWLPAWTPLFAGKRVWICYDRDVIGMRGAARVARALWPVASTVRLVDLPLPGIPDAKDLSDFFRCGGTADAFRDLLKGARSYVCRGYSTGRGAHTSLRRPYLLSASG